MNRIKELRKQSDIKQADLAKELSVAQNTLSYWENGKYEPDNKSLIKLSEIFNVSINYLLGVEDSKNLGQETDSESQDLIIPDDVKDVKISFTGKDFEELTQDEVDTIAQILKVFKARRNIK